MMVSVNHRTYSQTHRGLRDAQRLQSRKLPGAPARRASFATFFLNGVHILPEGTGES